MTKVYYRVNGKRFETLKEAQNYSAMTGGTIQTCYEKPKKVLNDTDSRWLKNLYKLRIEAKLRKNNA